MAKTPITTKVLIAMALGLLLGSLLNGFAGDSAIIQTFLVRDVFHVLGAAFINCLKMLVVPLVTFSLICGVCGIGDVSVLGRVGVKALLLYILTTAIAITLALLVAILIGPGKGFEPTQALASFTPAPAPPLTEVLITLIPGNPVQAFVEGNMLQIIYFVIVFAIAMLMSGGSGQTTGRIGRKAK